MATREQRFSWGFRSRPTTPVQDDISRSIRPCATTASDSIRIDLSRNHNALPSRSSTPLGVPLKTPALVYDAGEVIPPHIQLRAKTVAELYPSSSHRPFRSHSGSSVKPFPATRPRSNSGSAVTGSISNGNSNNIHLSRNYRAKYSGSVSLVSKIPRQAILAAKQFGMQSAAAVSAVAKGTSTLSISSLSRSHLSSRSVSEYGKSSSSVSSADEIESLRHEDLPEIQDISNPDSASQGPLRIVRIYREDGTFGTFACMLDISTDSLLRRVGRKFFISNIDDYCLLMRSVSRVRILEPDSQPVKDLKMAVQSIGAFKHDKLLQGQDFHSYLFQIQLVHLDRCSMPPAALALFCKRPQRLLIQNLDLLQFPQEILDRAEKIEILDISRCTPNLLSEEFVEKAANIRSLRLSMMFNFADSLPKYLERFTKLEHLNLSRNALKSTGIDLSQLKSLRYLNLSGNRLSELPAGISSLPLETLKVSTNCLRVFDTYAPTLLELDLSHNELEFFKDGFEKMSKLKRLYLANNKLRSLPTALELLPELELLDVRYNMLIEFSSHELPLVETLLVSHNPVDRKFTLSGTHSVPVPQPAPEIYQPKLPNVRLFDMEFSCFKFLPSKTMNLMTVINLKGTNLITLPEDFFVNLPLLEKVQLDSNSLTRLPTSLGDLQHLHYLSVANNSLTVLPREICQLPSLVELDVHANNLKAMPDDFWRLGTLKVLNIASNIFETLPICMIPRHKYLQASTYLDDRRDSSRSQDSNSSGSDSQDFTPAPGTPSERPCVNLVKLIAADNRLTEDLFECISHMSGLEYLNIAFNHISEIPSGALRHFPILKHIYACGNMLTTLPQDDCEHLPLLEFLSLSNNKLHSLPAELAKNKNLKFLDVSANQLRYNIANWPFDWNWRFNKKLRYLNLSSNTRLEIKRMSKNSAGSDNCDFTDFCVLPNLVTLGLIDITLIFPSIPEQNENVRVRAYGSELPIARIGVAETLGRHHRSINDFVIERFRGIETEALIGIFDGQRGPPTSGNKISKLAQQYMGILLKRELDSLDEMGETSDSDINDAIGCAFLGVHREIGNALLLPAEELPHTYLGQHCSVSSSDADLSSGTGAAVAYLKGTTLHFAALGGSQCVISRQKGDFVVLNTPHLPDDASLNQIRLAGATMVDYKIDGLVKYSRLLGCYDLDIALKRSPDVFKYELSDPQDVAIIATSEFWDHVPFETAADIARAEAMDLNYATSKLRALAVAFGATEELMIMCLGSKDNASTYGKPWELSKRRRNMRVMDSSIARVGAEVAPPLGDLALVFTDIKNSTMLWETMPVAMRAAIKTHSQIMRRTIRLHGGYEVKTEGDAFIVSFQTAVQALLWTLTVQRQLLDAPWPEELLACDECKPITTGDNVTIFRGLRIRMGIHWGHPVHERDPVTGRMDYFGPMVNKAARISSMALGGQVAMSQGFVSTLRHMEAVFANIHPQTLGTPPNEMASGNDLTEGSSQLSAFDQIERTFGLDFEAFTDTCKKAATLAAEGYTVVELGEFKLKGIETPESIYIAYPTSLRGRAEYAFIEDDRIPHISPHCEDASVTSALMLPLTQTLNCPSVTSIDPFDKGFTHPMNRDKLCFPAVSSPVTFSSPLATPISSAGHADHVYFGPRMDDTDTATRAIANGNCKSSTEVVSMQGKIDSSNPWQPRVAQFSSPVCSNITSLPHSERSQSQNIDPSLTSFLHTISARLEALCSPLDPQIGSWLSQLNGISAQTPELAIELYTTKIENAISTLSVRNILDDRTHAPQPQLQVTLKPRPNGL